jgi:bifunctional non-homologous end joining protein LigD
MPAAGGWDLSGSTTPNDRPIVKRTLRQVSLTHADKVLFPDDGITKADLADHYARVADAMLPHVRRRPLNMWRFNDGIDGQRVVQQELPRGAPSWLPTVRTPRRRGGSVRHAMANDASALRWLANQNCVTPHVWLARADRLERPDRLVFDLDPPEGVDFAAIRRAALALGELLRDRGLAPFAMTAGSRGVHVLVPLRRTRESDDVRDAARALAEELADAHADELTTEWRKAQRAGRILVDTARNTYAQTVVAPYATRPLPGAPVATPLAWDELEDDGLHAQRWTLRTIGERLDAVGDPWDGIARHARSLPRS